TRFPYTPLFRSRHHRRRGLADRAALPADADVPDHVAVHLHVHDDLVAAERVEPLDPGGRGRGQLTAVPGRAVVVEDDLAIEVFEAWHACRILPGGGAVSGRAGRVDGQKAKKSAAASMASASASTSASSLYTYSEARAVAEAPSTFMRGFAQWWPARTHTPCWSNTCVRSWGWRSRYSKDRTPPRSAGSAGPWMRRSSPKRPVSVRRAYAVSA